MSLTTPTPQRCSEEKIPNKIYFGTPQYLDLSMFNLSQKKTRNNECAVSIREPGAVVLHLTTCCCAAEGKEGAPVSEGCIRSHGNYRQHCQHSNHQQFINLRHKPSQTTITDDEATFADKKASVWLRCNALVGCHINVSNLTFLVGG